MELDYNKLKQLELILKYLIENKLSFEWLTDELRDNLLNEDDLPNFIDKENEKYFNYDLNSIAERFELLKNGKNFYPIKPYYRHLSMIILSWYTLGFYPNQLESIPGLAEVQSILDFEQKAWESQFLNNINTLFKQFDSLLNVTSTPDNDDKVKMLFNGCNDMLVEKVRELICSQLSLDRVLNMLGMRKTVGSSIALPHGPIRLVNSANLPHTPNSGSKLSVSARAFCKHANRSDNSFWGSGKGKEADKNQRSEKTILKILRDSSWINMHALPHNIIILEVRCSESYGLRWGDDGNFFRGTLEPMMENGHENGWKH